MDVTETSPGTVATGFDEFFKRELRTLEVLAFGLTGRRNLAEELAQEAMLVVYRRWASLPDDDVRAAFARRVVVNKSVSAFRRLVAEARALNRVRSRPDHTPWVMAEPDERLWRAVRGLPAREAQAITLRYVADLDARAIGEVLGCQEGHVRVILHRARRSLAAALGRDDEEGAS